MHIVVALRKDRTLPGSFRVLDDVSSSVLFGPVPCLGKADNNDAALHQNPTRDPKRSFGDTPTGTYKIDKLVPHTKGETDLHTYGAFPSLLLDPQTGDAMVAKQNGREGLMIHGGAPSSTGGLRPTHGCIRLAETSQKGLIDLVSTSIANVDVTVSET